MIIYSSSRRKRPRFSANVAVPKVYCYVDPPLMMLGLTHLCTRYLQELVVLFAYFRAVLAHSTGASRYYDVAQFLLWFTRRSATPDGNDSRSFGSLVHHTFAVTDRVHRVRPRP